MTPNIREARKYLYAAGILFLALDLVCIGILLSPWGKSRAHLQGRVQELQRQLQTDTRQIGPMRGMDKKIEKASATTVEFYNQRLPELYSEIDEALGAAEKESGVRLGGVRYGANETTRREELATPAGLRKVNISLTIAGQYVEDVKFINALERSKVFFVIQGVSLAGDRSEGQQGPDNGQTVGLELTVETYLRRGAA